MAVGTGEDVRKELDVVPTCDSFGKFCTRRQTWRGRKVREIFVLLFKVEETAVWCPLVEGHHAGGDVG